VAPLLGHSGVVRTLRGDRAGFLQALRDLYRRLPNYTIWLYVDGAGWHKGDAVDEFLRTHPRLGLDSLPRYQPALNPQERVWRRIRYEATTNRWFPDLDAIWTTVQRTRRSWSPRKLKRLCHIG
jgi:transposase